MAPAIRKRRRLPFARPATIMIAATTRTTTDDRRHTTGDDHDNNDSNPKYNDDDRYNQYRYFSYSSAYYYYDCYEYYNYSLLETSGDIASRLEFRSEARLLEMVFTGYLLGARPFQQWNVLFRAKPNTP